MLRIGALSLVACVSAQQTAFFVSGWFQPGASVTCTGASNEIVQNAIAVPGCNCDAMGCSSYTAIAGGKWAVKFFEGAASCTGPALITFPAVPADGSCVTLTQAGASYAVSLTTIKPTTLANCPWASDGVMLGATAEAGPCQCASSILKYGGNVQTTQAASTATLTWTAMGPPCYPMTDGKAFSTTLTRRISGSGGSAKPSYYGNGGIGIMDMSNMTWSLSPTPVPHKYWLALSLQQPGGAVGCTSTIASLCL